MLMVDALKMKRSCVYSINMLHLDQHSAETTAQEALGRQLAEARKLAHLTQPQLAQQTGLQQADISRIEHGLGNPTRDTLLKLADALGMEIVLRPKEGETKVQI